MCEFEWNRALLTMALINGAECLHACIRAIAYRMRVLIFSVQVSKNIINCNKLKLKFIVKRAISFRLSVVS